MGVPCQNRPSDDELRRLYIDQRLTSRQIATQVGVEKITVLRWLTAAGIEKRATGRGLANRGAEGPSIDALRHMVHTEHLSYRDIAARYGVDPSAVMHWVSAGGIERPTIWQTRRKGIPATEPTEDELRSRVEAGEPLRTICQDYTVSEPVLADRCRRYGIQLTPSGCYGRATDCLDGHRAKSSYEAKVDDWLFKHGLAHEVEPRYPFDRRYSADFLVGDTYIEVWGVSNNPRYNRRRQWKVEQCRLHELALIEIEPQQFADGGDWWSGLERLQDVVGDVA